MKSSTGEDVDRLHPVIVVDLEFLGIREVIGVGVRAPVSVPTAIFTPVAMAVFTALCTRFWASVALALISAPGA